jgi:MFS family permease
MNRVAERTRHRAAAIRDLALDVVGGRARARVVLTFAAILGLSGSDMGTLPAVAGNLERAFGIGNTQFGLLLTVVSLAAAAFTIPFGVLTDRTRRTRLLVISISLWAVAALFSGAAASYLWLILARVALGAVTAVTGPTIASLTGDFFPARDRARMWGMILGGELIGTGIGYVASGDISAAVSWRYALWWPIIPSVALAWFVWKTLPEPARGGQSWLHVGAEHIPDEEEAGPGARGRDGRRPDGTVPDARTGPAEAGQQMDALAQRAARRAHAKPEPALVLHDDPTGRSVWWAIRYVLRVRTNLVIIIASALGYFFFAGLRSFAIIFATSHYGISKPVATVLVLVIGAGALAGVFFGGRISDRMLRRGHIRVRVVVPAACLLAITPLIAPGIATTSVAVAIPLLTAGAVLLGAPNPPMDAARLDIIHPHLWGRAEGVRSTLRTIGEAAAPLVFGYVSQYVFGGPGSAAGSGGAGGAASAGSAAGTALQYTFLVFLIPLIAAGLLVLPALRTYPRDVATATASVRAIRESRERPGTGDQRGEAAS